jgi:hypothetical protein
METAAATMPTPGIDFSYAIFLQQVGRFEEALDHVERMIDLHIGGCVFLGVDPALKGLCGHPRYEAALKRVGVPLQRTASAAHTAST